MQQQGRKQAGCEGIKRDRKHSAPVYMTRKRAFPKEQHRRKEVCKKEVCVWYAETRQRRRDQMSVISPLIAPPFPVRV
jgi:hypothetical protein